MLRKNLASSRLVRVGVFGLVTFAGAAITSDSAQARRHYRHHYTHHVRHHDSDDSYSPQFSSIVIDGNSGATLAATSPDGIRHPASLTKIMTLYLLFERLDTGKMKLDTEMPVSAHASDQDPTKLDLRPGQTIKVEDAIKGLVTRSANDAAVVIAEAIGGSEDEFAKMMTRKARALGMSKTVYRNASGLPNDEQVTTARDQATLGRAIQDRFPRYYRYFSTQAFTFRGHSISNHNHLLGNVEGVDGIKTGYTRASGFNLVTSMHRGNRFLVGVVLGGRSGGSRDAIMRNLLAENLGKAATSRTVAAIAERNSTETTTDLADAEAQPKAMPAPEADAQEDAAPASADSWSPAMRAPASKAVKVTAALAEATAAAPAAQAKVEPAPLSSGVIHTQPIAAIPGASEPMKPVKVKTVQVRAGSMKLASAGPPQPAPPPPMTGAVAQKQPAVPETSNAVVARAAEIAKPEPARAVPARAELPPQPPGHGTGNGVLGVLPASSLAAAAPVAQQVAPVPVPPTAPVPAPVVVASAQPAPPPAPPVPAVQPQIIQQNGAIKPVVHTGWIVQVGALETESEAQQRIQAAKDNARGLLSKADSFTEPVIAKDNRKLFRARFAGLEREQAEAVCRALKRSDIPCITARN